MNCACGRPTRNDAYVCDNCCNDLAKALGDVPWIEDEIETTITKQRAAGGAMIAGGEKPLPYHPRAVKVRDKLRHELVMLVRFCDEEGVRSSSPDAELPEDTLAEMSRWLLWRVDGLAFNDMAAEFIESVSRAVHDCHRAIDLPPERSYAGPCPECKRDLYHRPDATETKCRGCGQTFDVGEINAWMQDRITEHMTDRLVTAHEGATLLSRFGLETAQRTIEKWHERKKLDEAGHVRGVDGKMRRLFRWEDVLALAVRHAQGRGASA